MQEKLGAFGKIVAKLRKIRPGVVRRRNLVFSHRGEVCTDACLPPGFRLEEVSQATLSRYFQDAGSARRRLRYERFLAAGARGLLVVTEDQWASALWLAPPTVKQHPVQVPPRVSGKAWWLFELHTHASFRRKGLNQFLLRESLKYVGERSPGALVAADVNPSNLASRASFAKSGFAEEGVLSAVTVTSPFFRPRSFGVWRRTTRHPDPKLEERGRQ